MAVLLFAANLDKVGILLFDERPMREREKIHLGRGINVSYVLAKLAIVESMSGNIFLLDENWIRSSFVRIFCYHFDT